MYVAARAMPGRGPGFVAYLAVGLGLYMAAGAANAIELGLNMAMTVQQNFPGLFHTVCSMSLRKARLA